MAICICDREVNTIYLDEVTRGKLFQYFLKENNINNIVVVYDLNGDFYGTCTYGLVLSATDDISCISKEKTYISETFWEETKTMFCHDSNLKYLPVFNKNDELVYFCYDDDSLDIFLKEIYEMHSHENWMLLKSISPMLEAICFFDFNEVTFRFYELAVSRDIPVVLIGEKWEAFSLSNNFKDLGLYPDYSMLIIQSGNRNNYQEDKNWKQSKPLSFNYEIIHQVFFSNALCTTLLRTMKIDESSNSIKYAKNILIKRMREQKFDMHYLFASADKKVIYTSLKRILTVEEFVIFVHILKNTWKKKIAAIYGNCETEMIANYLLDTDKFVEEYFIVELPRICYCEREICQNYWPEEIVKCFDLLVYQVIKKDNKFGERAASEYLLNDVGIDCRLISITNAYFNGYFPQLTFSSEYREKYNRGIIEHWGDALFPFPDNEIIKEYVKHGNISDVINCLMDEDYYQGNEQKVIDNMNESFEELGRREQECDVKILDYIKENYKKTRLFSEPLHPSNQVLIEMTRRLLDKLNIENYHIKEKAQEELLCSLNMLIYPSVRKILGLEFEVKEYYYNRHLNKQAISFEEYVELFIRNSIKMS